MFGRPELTNVVAARRRGGVDPQQSGGIAILWARRGPRQPGVSLLAVLFVQAPEGAGRLVRRSRPSPPGR